MPKDGEGFSLPLKIIITGLLLIIVFIVLIIYSRELNHNKPQTIEEPILKTQQ